MTSSLLLISANPLLNLVHAGSFTPGVINRIGPMAVHAEGKGVNVARVLARHGHAVQLTGFAGGHSGAWLRDLIRAEGIGDRLIDSAAPVRVGFMASCAGDSHPTTLLPRGFPVTAEECSGLLAQIAGCLDSVRLVIISGSVPDPAAHRLYADILALCRTAGVPCWLDAHGPALVEALAGAAPPALAKPNREEYGESSDWSRVEELHVTDGEAPVRVESRLEGRWQVVPPVLRQVNPVGCGDCYLAGLAHGWLLGWPLPERLRYASAAGAANALRPDVAMITPAEIRPLLDAVTVVAQD